MNEQNEIKNEEQIVAEAEKTAEEQSEPEAEKPAEEQIVAEAEKPAEEQIVAEAEKPAEEQSEPEAEEKAEAKTEAKKRSKNKENKETAPETKTRKRLSPSKINLITTIVLVAVMVLALVPTIIIIANSGAQKPLEIPDENGAEDYSLAVLTSKEICAEFPKYSCRVYGMVKMDENRSNMEENSAYDADKIVAEAAAEFSGVAVLQKTYGKEDKLTFTVNCERTKGNMRVVLVDKNLNVIHEFDLGESSVYELANAKGKSYEIRIACESAEFNVTVERSFG